MASALGSLGAIVTPERCVDATSGEKRVHFLLSAKCGKANTARLRADYREGKLAAGHLLRRFFVGFGNREVFLQWLERPDGGLRLEKSADGWKLVGCEGGLPGVISGQAVFRTQNLKVAVAFMTAGYEVLAVEGSWGNFRFLVSATGPEGFAPDVLKQWREAPDSFGDESIFAAVCQGLYNREALISRIPEGYGRIVMRKPGTQRAVMLPEAAGPVPVGVAEVATGAEARKVPVMSCGAVMRVLMG
jgi:hypothetical protein